MFWFKFFPNENNKKLLWKGQYYPKVQASPDPTDIYWENLGISRCRKILKLLITKIFTVVILLIGLSTLYFIRIH